MVDTGLRGRVVIVSGASQGMGRAAAELFAAEGANVAMCARTARTLSEAADAIRKKTHAEVLDMPVDVSSQKAVQAFVQAVMKKFGRVDVCVANAGGPPSRNFIGATDDEWQKAFETNFLSVVHLAREVVPEMQKNSWGRFITITSTSVRQAIPDLILSNSIRPAVVGLIKSLAQEFGKDGITFNNVAPGYTETERLTDLAGIRAVAAGITVKDIYERWAAEIPLRRLGKPEEIADVIVWLASARASYVTGQTILVDGGIYKGM